MSEMRLILPGPDPLQRPTGDRDAGTWRRWRSRARGSKNPRPICPWVIPPETVGGLRSLVEHRKPRIRSIRYGAVQKSAAARPDEAAIAPQALGTKG
jgi:hypothetical protein